MVICFSIRSELKLRPQISHWTIPAGGGALWWLKDSFKFRLNFLFATQKKYFTCLVEEFDVALLLADDELLPDSIELLID